MKKSNYHPLVLLVVYWLLSVFHGYFIGAIDALKQMLMAFGVGKDLNPAEQSKFLASLTNIGFSSALLLSVPNGILLDVAGSKVCAFLGVLANVVAMSLWCFFSNRFLHILAAVMLGFPVGSLGNAVLGLSILFPGWEGTVFGFLNSGGDLSCFMPLLLEVMAIKFGTVTIGFIYLGVGIVSLLAVIIYVPSSFENFVVMNGSEETETKKLNIKMKSVPSVSDEAEYGATSQAPTSTQIAPLAHLNFVQQITSPNCLIYSALFFANVFCRTYFAQCVREIFGQVAVQYGKPEDAGLFYVNLLNAILPFAAVCVLFLSYLSDVWGFYRTVGVVNVASAAVFLAAGFLPFTTQIIAVLGQVIVSSYCLTQMVQFVTVVFGFKFMGTLQGIQNMAGVVAVWCFGPWNGFVETFLKGSHIRSCQLLFFARLPLLMLPSLLSWLHRTQQEKISAVRFAITEFKPKLSMMSSRSSGLIFGKKSLNVLPDAKVV